MSPLVFVPNHGLIRVRQRNTHSNSIVQRTTHPIVARQNYAKSNTSSSPHKTWLAIPRARTPIQSMRIVVLTDFSSNPFLAVRDRVSDPLSAIMIAFAALVGGFVSWLVKAKGTMSNLPLPNNLDQDAQDMSASDTAAREVYQLRDNDSINITKLPSPARITAGENAVWLNMSLSTLWRLFRKSTNGLVKDVLQPVLDEMHFPHFVESVTLSKLTLGESPCLVRKIQRLPSRALNEIQYRFDLRLVGDKEGKINVDVHTRIPGTNRMFTVPICVSALDIDAKVWVGLTVVPYKPWLRFAQWALVSMPIVKMHISIADLIPVTAVPVLSNFLRKTFTTDIPQKFLFPNTQNIDLMEECDTEMRIEEGLLKARGVQVPLEQLSNEEICSQFPILTSLFNSVDINSDGYLSPEEISRGLVEWGYASQAERRSVINLLDIDNDGIVSLREFVSVWGNLKNVFVPRRFRGIVSGVLLRAEGLRGPIFGFTDPYVIVSVESQKVTSKRNNATSRTGEEEGSAVWNEGWELYVEHPKSATLRVEVREGCRFTFYRGALPPPPRQITHSGALTVREPDRIVSGRGTLIGYGSLAVSDLHSYAEAIWVNLTTGGGRVRLDVQFSQFIDPTLI